MPRDIFDAAMKGDNDVLIRRLGLQTKEQTEIQEDGDSDHESTKDLPFGPEIMPLTQRTSPFATKSNVTVRSELQSATRSGDTVLHLLVTKMHNELALKVFERDPSLLKMQNKMLETPLHRAAKVGNQEVIQMLIRTKPSVVKDALQETNEKGDTAMHVAVRYNCAYICCNLMQLDSEVAYNINKEMFSPFHIAIHEKHDFLVEQMLCVDPILACTQLTDEMFPVHLAARKNNWNMVLYFMKHFPDYAELVDYRGRNLFHFVAEEADGDDFFEVLSGEYEDMTTRMNNATDYEGNTPLHIAAMKGHRWTMHSIWRAMTNCVAETVNNRGLTPCKIFYKHLEENLSNEDYMRIIRSRIRAYERWHNGEKFTEEWFSYVMAQQQQPPSLENKWERTQVTITTTVLIITVTFAAAFTIPGGYNQDHGTPVLGRRYMFWAFILANALAFIQGFLSLFALLLNTIPDIAIDTFKFATVTFLVAASSMVVAFGLGLYVTLAPVCLPIAIILLVITLFIGFCPAWLFFWIMGDIFC
ncbi:Ankyrin repeat-containing protein [Carex littledalei]|uniref:Ankyrin repeat-containing protein n=1 Tax=Carex littledalei TaxID=544730 RepID=A0A833RXU8_9POAL|nr:Ankyrin repeat-containing protein [Carex littledalei]